MIKLNIKIILRVVLPYNWSVIMKKLIMSSMFFLVVLVCSRQNVYACKCIVPPPPIEAIEDADAVFSGTVIAKKRRHNFIKVTFKVLCVWKGGIEEEITLYTPSQSAACGFSFERGRNYFVYANNSQSNIPGNILTTNLCTRTKTLLGADEDITDLGDGRCFD